MDDVKTIESFYEAFGRADGEAMAACYSPDARFSDPVFTDLQGPQVGAMWRMLTSQATDLEIQLLEHDARSAHWLAHYTFSQTGRKVVNDVRATFRFAEDGTIEQHTDRFDFGRWARQALGLPGLLLGRTPLLRVPVQKRAARSLASYMARDA